MTSGERATELGIDPRIAEETKRLNVPSEELNRLALILGGAMRPYVAGAPSGFAEGYLAACKAIVAIADEQDKRKGGAS